MRCLLRGCNLACNRLQIGALSGASGVTLEDLIDGPLSPFMRLSSNQKEACVDFPPREAGTRLVEVAKTLKDLCTKARKCFIWPVLFFNAPQARVVDGAN